MVYIFFKKIFFILSCLATAEYLQLTNDNFQDILNGKRYNSIIGDFWNPWCQHCKNFRPIWDEFSNLKNGTTKDTLFVDCDCINNKDVCKKFSISSYPTIMWIDLVENQKIEYTGSHTIEGLNIFLNKQQNFPLIQLKSHSDIEDIMNLTETSTVFIMEYQNETDPSFIFYREIAKSQRKSESHFFVLKGKNSELKVYMYHDYFIKFQEEFTHVNIENFITSHLHPLVMPLTGVLVDELESKNEMAVVLFINDTIQLHEFNLLVRNITSKYMFIYHKYTTSDYYSKFIGIDKNKIPQVVLLNPSRGKWSFYKGKLEYSMFNDWIIKSNNKTGKWKGPGTNVFMGNLYSIIAQGGALLYVIAGCLCAILLIMIYVILDVYRMMEREKKNE